MRDESGLERVNDSRSAEKLQHSSARGFIKGHYLTGHTFTITKESSII